MTQTPFSFAVNLAAALPLLVSRHVVSVAYADIATPETAAFPELF